jgi:hypothetical protein
MLPTLMWSPHPKLPFRCFLNLSQTEVPFSLLAVLESMPF